MPSLSRSTWAKPTTSAAKRARQHLTKTQRNTQAQVDTLGIQRNQVTHAAKHRIHRGELHSSLDLYMSEPIFSINKSKGDLNART